MPDGYEVLNREVRGLMANNKAIVDATRTPVPGLPLLLRATQERVHRDQCRRGVDAIAFAHLEKD